MRLITSLFTTQGRFLVLRGVYTNKYSSVHFRFRCVHSKITQIDIFEQELSKLNFQNYQKFNEINEAYNDFIQKPLSVIDKFTPINKKASKAKLSGMV